jgi:dissimilatory sulfite reductase (desulfoviridin) alpha/beta subunit
MPALTVPAAEEKRLKGLGFINNKGTDAFSARVVTGFGRLSARQLRALAEAAERFGDGCVSLTTRLSAEVTGIPYEKIGDFRAFLAENGMETGGTGSLVRPIVCCKGTTCGFGLLDTYALAAELHERFYRGYHEVKLPHKFKIAVGGCPNNCVKPTLNDIGIVGWRGGCRIYIGGRWGKKQAVGRPLGRVLTETEDVMRAVERAILLFRDEGRPGERFGDVIDRLGFETVEAALLSEGKD